MPAAVRLREWRFQNGLQGCGTLSLRMAIFLRVMLLKPFSLQRAFSFDDMLPEFVLEVPEQAVHRPHGSGRESAEGIVQELYMLPEDIDMIFTPLPGLDQLQQVDHVGEPLAAGGTPAAGFAGVKADQVQGGRHHAGVLVEDHDAAGAEPRPGLGDRIEIHLYVPMLSNEI